MVRLRQGDRAGMEPDRSFPPAAGYVIASNVRVSYTVETDGTGYSASAWSKPAGVMSGWPTILPEPLRAGSHAVPTFGFLA
jgi:hypothetical protein